MAITWTCPSCGFKVSVPDSAMSPVRCPCGNIDRNPIFAGGTPVVRPVIHTAKPESSIGSEEWLKLVHSLWLEAHSHIPNEDSPVWFANWLSRIPNFGCSCQDHFKEVRKLIPEDFSSLEAWRKVTWQWHNTVRERQGKPQFSWEEACQIHSWNDQ